MDNFIKIGPLAFRQRAFLTVCLVRRVVIHAIHGEWQFRADCVEKLSVQTEVGEFAEYLPAKGRLFELGFLRDRLEGRCSKNLVRILRSRVFQHNLHKAVIRQTQSDVSCEPNAVIGFGIQLIGQP